MASNLFGRAGLAVVGAAVALTASADAATIIFNTVVTNTSNSVQTYSITETAVASVAGPTLISGSVTGTVTDLNGNSATVAPVFGGSIYTAIIDLVNPVQSLLTGAPAAFSAGQFLSGNSTPEAFFNVPSIQVNNFISIRLEFTLTPGDSASFTSIFTVIPSPAGFAVMGGLVALRRRRRD
ncbi:MAG: hypothetical protein KF724_00710 [Phycisphaeraceae bacterium]|nr:hypothetical protein [Phycisphaeraceae bacterium]